MVSHRRNVTRWAIAQFWSTTLDLDLFWPRCFACQYSPAEAKEPEAGRYRQAWNQAVFLERAHIVADMEGGLSVPANLVLLCKRCHKESPMLTEPQAMLDWITNRQSWFQWIIQQFSGEAERLNVPMSAFDDVDTPRFIRYLRHLKISADSRSVRGELPVAGLVYAAREFDKLRKIFEP